MLRTRDRRRPPRLGGRDNVVVLTSVGLAAASIYVAQPVVALLWAGLAIVGGVVFLVQDRPGRPVAIAALIFAGIGLMWTVVRLGAPH
jgi:hypothetical protein